MSLPTKLTVSRIVLAIIVIFILVFPLHLIGIDMPRFEIYGVYIKLEYVIAGVLFIIASITDALDGKIARKRNLVSDLGKMLDAIADKILVDSVLIILACQGFIHVIVPVVIIVRDIVVDALKMEVASHGKVVAAILSGKIKTACLMVGVVLSLFYNMPFELINIDVANFSLYVATVMAVVSMVQYMLMTRDVLAQDKK